eukprot:3230782-Prymnesium_polylepis.2
MADPASDFEWPGWRTYAALGACIICASAAILSIYLSYVPASLISLDGTDAAISLQPHFTTDRIGQLVLGRQQGEIFTPRILRPLRHSLRDVIENAIDGAIATLPGDRLLFDVVTMDALLRERLEILKVQCVQAIDTRFIRNERKQQLNLPQLAIQFMYTLCWAEDGVFVQACMETSDHLHSLARRVHLVGALLRHRVCVERAVTATAQETARQLGIIVAAVVQAKLRVSTSFLNLEAPLRAWVSEHAEAIAL